MRAHIITIFPEVFEALKDFGIFRVAQEKGQIQFYIHNLRDFTKDKHKTTDDRPYGGGAGMVMLVEPVQKVIKYIEKSFGGSFKILTTPQGEKFDEEIARFLSLKESITLIPAHYEGIDERVSRYVDMELSIGDYILSGGELPALVVLDAVTRLLPGVLGNEESSKDESFSKNLLEYPHYTRPREFEKQEVPEVLLSGDHERIRLWRLKESLRRTLLKRPDLLAKHEFSDEEKKLINEIFDEIEQVRKEIKK